MEHVEFTRSRGPRQIVWRHLSAQGDSDHPSSPFISEIEHCREKCFRQKLYGFEGDIRWYHWFDLEELLDGHMKVIFNFLNRTYYFSLHILLFFSSGAFSPAGMVPVQGPC